MLKFSTVLVVPRVTSLNGLRFTYKFAIKLSDICNLKPLFADHHIIVYGPYFFYDPLHLLVFVGCDFSPLDKDLFVSVVAANKAITVLGILSLDSP